MNSRTRWALGFGSAGLVGGLALGVTGFAGAASPSPSPQQHARPFGGAHKQFGFRERFGGVGGLVSSVGGNSLTIDTPRGPQKIGLTGSTTYYDEQTKATKSILRAGEIVRVRLVDPTASNLVAAVVRVLPAHIEGWITAIGSNSITVTDLSGFTRTINTSDATKYLKDGVASTRSALSVGALIRAAGSVDSDGTTLDATKVALGIPKLQRGMPGGMPGDMPGGPGMPGAGMPAPDSGPFSGAPGDPGGPVA